MTGGGIGSSVSGATEGGDGHAYPEIEKRYTHVRARIHRLFDEPPGDDRLAFGIQAFLAAVVLLNTVTVVIYTVPWLEEEYWLPLNGIMTACLLVFTIEYVVRLWACTSAPTLAARTTYRIQYASSFYMIIDLVSIVPLVFPLFFPRDFALLRAFRLLSIFKLGRYARKSQSLALLKRVVMRKREIFTLMVFFLVFVILFSSTIMYLVEHQAQPEKFSSIPAAIWWSMMTVTTVGYGDIYPVTPLGQSIASLFTLGGVLLLALPSAILASGFIEERHKQGESGLGIPLEREIEMLEKVGYLHEKGVISEKELEEYRHTIRILAGKKG